MDAVGGSAISLRNISSPTPYLFGGLAFMFGLIAMALMLLAFHVWTHWNISMKERSNVPMKDKNRAQ